MKMEQTECSETSAYKIQTPGNYQEEKAHNTLPLVKKFPYFTANEFITVFPQSPHFSLS